MRSDIQCNFHTARKVEKKIICVYALFLCNSKILSKSDDRKLQNCELLCIEEASQKKFTLIFKIGPTWKCCKGLGFLFYPTNSIIFFLVLDMNILNCKNLFRELRLLPDTQETGKKSTVKKKHKQS